MNEVNENKQVAVVTENEFKPTAPEIAQNSMIAAEAIC